jgi:hypothetical protein
VWPEPDDEPYLHVSVTPKQNQCLDRNPRKDIGSEHFCQPTHHSEPVSSFLSVDFIVPAHHHRT